MKQTKIKSANVTKKNTGTNSCGADKADDKDGFLIYKHFKMVFSDPICILH